MPRDFRWKTIPNADYETLTKNTVDFAVLCTEIQDAIDMLPGPEYRLNDVITTIGRIRNALAKARRDHPSPKPDSPPTLRVVR